MRKQVLDRLATMRLTAGWEPKEDTVWISPVFTTDDGKEITDAKVTYHENTDKDAKELITNVSVMSTYIHSMMGSGPELSYSEKRRLEATIKKQLEDEAWSRNIQVDRPGPPSASSLPLYIPKE